jgi:hypothetical protein
MSGQVIASTASVIRKEPQSTLNTGLNGPQTKYRYVTTEKTETDMSQSQFHHTVLGVTDKVNIHEFRVKIAEKHDKNAMTKQKLKLFERKNRNGDSVTKLAKDNGMRIQSTSLETKCSS